MTEVEAHANMHATRFAGMARAGDKTEGHWAKNAGIFGNMDGWRYNGTHRMHLSESVTKAPEDMNGLDLFVIGTSWSEAMDLLPPSDQTPLETYRRYSQTDKWLLHMLRTEGRPPEGFSDPLVLSDMIDLLLLRGLADFGSTAGWTEPSDWLQRAVDIMVTAKRVVPGYQPSEDMIDTLYERVAEWMGLLQIAPTKGRAAKPGQPGHVPPTARAIVAHVRDALDETLAIGYLRGDFVFDETVAA